MAERGLTTEEQETVEENLRFRAPIVYQIIRQEGLEELARPVTSLWWSGVAAGLCLSISVIAEGLLQMALPGGGWSLAVQNVGYTVGFVIVVLGRLQLFTENTITAVLPLIAQWNRRNLFKTGRLWGVVFLANLVGTFLAALVMAKSGIATEAQLHSFLELSHHLGEKSAAEALLHGIPAGFLLAAMVWMLPSAKAAEFWVIILMTYLIAIGDFTHVIAGSNEVFLLMLTGELPVLDGFLDLIAPAFIGNVIGGTGLFSLLAYGQVKEEM